MPGSTNTPTIGFIGVGMMGHGICLNLSRAGYRLQVLAHRNRVNVDDLIRRGAREAGSLEDLAASANVVMICVNSADTVAMIVEAILPVLTAGKAIIDVTTSMPEASRALSQRAAAKGVAFLDAPVVGGPAQAADGKLGTFVGGSETDLQRLRPILAAYSTEVVHFGPAGSGNTAKLLHNFLTVGLRLLVTHAFRAARRHGIDWEKLYALSRQGGAASRTLDTMVEGAIAADYARNKFSIANCHKDMSYVAPLLADDPDGRAIQVAMEAAYRRLVAAGFGDLLSGEMLNPAVEAATLGRTTPE